MPVIAVINRKGGSGKSTMATHLAAWLARQGAAVMLGDVDRQQSTRTWLKRRSPALPSIAPWTIDQKNVLKVPPGVTHVVLDTPGGLHGFELAKVVMAAHAILVPVCHSVFDRESAAACITELMALPRLATGRCKLGVVGMRIDARTHAAQTLREWAQTLDVPFLGVLREAQAYVRSLDSGHTLFDQRGATGPHAPPLRGSLALQAAALPESTPLLAVPPCAGRPGAAAISPEGAANRLGGGPAATSAQADLDQWAPILEWLQPITQLPLSAATVPAPVQDGPPTALSHSTDEPPGGSKVVPIRPQVSGERIAAPRAPSLMPAQESLVHGSRLSVFSPNPPQGQGSAHAAKATVLPTHTPFVALGVKFPEAVPTFHPTDRCGP